jgi:hypothetical protein
MVKINELQQNYANTVAGQVVSPMEAANLLQGLNAFNEPSKTYVDYDVLRKGYIVTKTLQFDSFNAAMRMVRKLNAIALTRPIIYNKE